MLLKSRFGNNITLIRTLLLYIVLISIATASMTAFIWIKVESEQLNKQLAGFSEDYQKSQRAYLKQEVNRIHQRLHKEWERSRDSLRTELKSQVEQAHQIATNLYSKYKDKYSKDELQSIIREALRDVRFQDGRVYYYITGLNKIEYLNPPRPDWEGFHSSTIFSPAGQEVVDLLVDFVNKNNEGFVEHIWHRPGYSGIDHQKLSYVKRFAPYDWMIGAGDYYDGVESSFKAHNFKEISKIRIVHNNHTEAISQDILDGFFSIATFNGKLYVDEGKYYAKPKNAWEDADANGLKYIQVSSKIAKENPEGGFFNSSWYDSKGKKHDKIAYVLGLHEWDVFITLCFSLEVINQAIDQQAVLLKKQLSEFQKTMAVVISIALISMLALIYLTTLRIAKNINSFQRSFAQASLNQVKIDTDEIYFKEFKSLAVSANNMINSLNNQANELRERSLQDDLTTLPNRRYATKQLDQLISESQEKGQHIGFIFIDLDHFKEVNDTFGHSAGDYLLIKVAERLRHVVSDDGSVARLGGDEFTVTTHAVESESKIETIAARIIDSFSDPFDINGSSRYISASLGISIYPRDGNNTEILLRNADSAMYEAKHNGRNVYKRYEQAMTAKVANRFMIVEELHAAILKQEFVLYYQSQTDLNNGKLVGAEALIRWNHPTRGLLGPIEFIPVAETSGQIEAIGKWVLFEACQRIVDWKNRGVDIPKVAVNISNNQLHDHSLVELVTQALQETNCAPDWLELEITESTLMRYPEKVVDELSQLQEKGVSIAIDDFGTGYSSLSALKNLPISKLKIDRSFISDLNRNEDDKEIVKAIIAMGSSLRLSIIAEGIEEQEQLEYLAKIHCDQGQGYYFSKPIPEKQFIASLEIHSKNKKS